MQFLKFFDSNVVNLINEVYKKIFDSYVVIFVNLFNYAAFKILYDMH